MSEDYENTSLASSHNAVARVVLIVSAHTIYRNSLYLKHLLTGLADESIATALVCPGDSDIKDIVVIGVEVIRHPAIDFPFMDRWNKKVLLNQLEKFGPTVLHCLCPSLCLLTRQLARQLDLKYVVTIDSVQKRYGRLKFSSKRLAKIIVPAKSVANSVAKFYPRFAGRIEQINSGTFAGEAVGCFSQADRLVSIIVAGAIDNAADFKKLFGAIKHLAIDGTEFMVILIGAGKEERQLRDMLAALELLPIVTFAPNLGDMRAVLSAGDIFIMPQPDDTFSPLLLEAMSVGCVTVGCGGGVDDLVTEPETTMIFDTDDQVSIYEGLRRLFDDRQFARQLAANAQNQLKQHHKVSKMISSTLRIYTNS